MAEEDRILIVEDDPVSLAIMQKMLQNRSYIIDTAGNGREALEKFARQPFQLVVTDIHMPEMGGRELIQNLAESEKNPVIIVVSGEEDLQTVLKIMRQGVYDYLVKPVEHNEFNYKIERGLELSRLRRQSHALMAEREIVHSQKIDWNAWKDAILRRNMEKIEVNLFANIKTSFSQSAGFGGLISIVPFIRMQSREEDGYFRVSKDIVELMEKNAGAAQKTFEKFDEISEIIGGAFNLESIPFSRLFVSLEGLVKELAPIAGIKKMDIVLSPLKNAEQFSLKVDKTYLLTAIRELLLNAIRFSRESSSIFIHPENRDEGIKINILSDPSPGKEGVLGIPQEYEKLIFEPFYRLNMTVDERFDTLDFGIGLTVVDKILRKQNGSVHLRNITDYTNVLMGPREKVEASIHLPFD